MCFWNYLFRIYYEIKDSAYFFAWLALFDIKLIPNQFFSLTYEAWRQQSGNVRSKLSKIFWRVTSSHLLPLIATSYLNKKEVRNNVPQKQHKTFFEGINPLPPQGQY